ncbi:MAG: efflux RND transporter periplasmic adaptor subunit [Siculibacillus sp.]|nr:efflux RND transporter periplasmic adaptor subunit [Siculibacillus sp.]
MTLPRAIPAEPVARFAAPHLGMRRGLLAAGFVAGVILAAAPTWAADGKVVHPVRVDDTKEVLATVESVRTPQARARIGGTVESLVVVEGDRVKKGDVIATVVDPKLKLQLAAFDARIAALEAKLALVQTELDRARQLRASGSAPQSRLDDAETQLTVTQAEIAAARADKSSLQEQVTEGRVVAPNDGRILKIQAVAGQVIMPGEPVATVATAAYILKLRLPERHARFMHEGDRVLVAGRGLDVGKKDHLGEGKITKVYPELDQGRVVADAEAAGIGDYFVGERIRVLVSTGSRETLVLPEDLVVHRHGLTFVKLAGRGEVPVQTGMRMPDKADEMPWVEILSGLVAGDEVVRP